MKRALISIPVATLTVFAFAPAAPVFAQTMYNAPVTPVYLSAVKHPLKSTHSAKAITVLHASKKSAKATSKLSSKVARTKVKKSPDAARSVSLPTGTEESENWSGYVVSSASASLTSITGTWSVPRLNSSQPWGRLSLAGEWIGLGGVTSGDLLQMGTIEQGNSKTAELFWEQLPQSAQNVAAVPVGSQIRANIETTDGTDFTLSFDVTEPSGKTLTKSISVTLTNDYAKGIGSSAEWISEDPSDANGNLYSFANTGTVTFSGAEANSLPINAPSFTVTPLAMINARGQMEAVPSALSSDGESFSISRSNQVVRTNTRVFHPKSHMKWRR